MRSYYVAATAGVLLIASAFLPWMSVGEESVGGVPDPAGFWILGLGVIAVLLAGLSIWTRKNSRHPLLLVGLTSFAIMFLGYQWMSRAVRDAAWARAQARAIVEGTPAAALPQTTVGFGIYLGVVAAIVLVGFGLTIVIRKVPSPYAVPNDDD
jgi:Na+/H+ antiporter NhaC